MSSTSPDTPLPPGWKADLDQAIRQTLGVPEEIAIHEDLAFEDTGEFDLTALAEFLADDSAYDVALLAS